MKAFNLYSSQCILGEGPYWHAEKKSFFWVDIENGMLFQHILHSKKTNTWKFEHRLSVVIEGQGDKLILALDQKIARFDLATAELEWLVEVDKNQAAYRFNDGKCDANGCLWIGTLTLNFIPGSGSLYKIDQNLKAEKQLEQLTISNGMIWTEDNQTMYFIDSPTQEVRAYHFDLEKGILGFDRVAIEIPKALGTPDGMTIDQEDNLWIAHYGGSGVFCWNPRTGKLLDKIELPVPHITSCVFGGENLDYLLITTASENLNETQLTAYPESGDVFIVKTNTRGYLPNKCGF